MSKSGDAVINYIESQSYTFSDLGISTQDVKERIKKDSGYVPKEQIVRAVYINTSAGAPDNYSDIYGNISSDRIIDATKIRAELIEIKREIRNEEDMARKQRAREIEEARTIQEREERLAKLTPQQRGGRRSVEKSRGKVAFRTIFGVD